MPEGRPSDYTPDVAAHICGQLVEGRSLRSICKADDMPGLSTVFKWLAARPEFVEQYTRAREAQADTLADELIDIADDSTNDYYDKVVGSEGETQRVVDSEHINRSRLRVDTRKWVASKLKPKKYGDKVDHTLAGPGGGPIVIQSTPTDEAL